MNLLFIESRHNFVVVTPNTHLMLCGGTHFNESDFKDFLYKLIHRVPYLEELDKKSYVGDGILIRRVSLDIHMNMDHWNSKNYKELSKKLFEYCINHLHLNNYHFIDLTSL